MAFRVMWSGEGYPFANFDEAGFMRAGLFSFWDPAVSVDFFERWKIFTTDFLLFPALMCFPVPAVYRFFWRDLTDKKTEWRMNWMR